MQEWERRLKHERVLRDAWVACGNPAPDKPDPPGGLVRVPTHRFDGTKFRAVLTADGHDSTEYERCSCRTRSG